MSLYGPIKIATIVINTATSSEVNLEFACDFIQVELPTLTSCTLKITTSFTSGGTFQDLGSGVTTVTTTGAYNTVFRLGGWQFIKLVSSVNQGAERTISVRGLRG